MGVKEKTIDQVTKTLSENSIGEKLHTLRERISNNKTETKNELKSIHPYNHHLWITSHLDDSNMFVEDTRSYYEIKDDHNNIIYTAKGNKESQKFKIMLFDNKKKKTAKIVENVNFHNLISHKKQYIYTCYIGKNMIGKINRTVYKRKDIITFNSNEITTEKRNKNIYPLINSNNNLIAEIHSKPLFTFLDYNNKDNEILIILFALLL